MNIKKTANLLLNFAIKRLAEIFGIIIFVAGIILLLALMENRFHLGMCDDEQLFYGCF